ncbi:hypothetical protein ACIQVE_09365 [Pseudomonas sp. NPDC098747]|uniref:hypothetical protein n=1 Tax=Pseudomonas sp. NPDC098747 TaxID=3364487 RepID=UPI00383A1D3D
MKVTKESGELLFDTDLICYGLVKSGYVTYQETWSRRTLRSAQLDPNNGANWVPVSVTYDPAHKADALYGFTLYNSISPIVFLVGPGCLNGTSLAGNAMTFLFSNADASTKFYCFDLMADNIPGSPYMKTRNVNGLITFNSLQPPLNIVYAIQAPAPPTPSGGKYGTTYSGGYNYNLNSGPVNQYNRSRLISRIDIPLSAGYEYAAYLPWSRSVGIYDASDIGGYPAYIQYGGAEGAFGGMGNMSFIFGASAGTTMASPLTANTHFFSLPIDRFPVALVIKTNNLPFPYN